MSLGRVGSGQGEFRRRIDAAVANQVDIDIVVEGRTGDDPPDPDCEASSAEDSSARWRDSSAPALGPVPTATRWCAGSISRAASFSTAPR